LYCLLVYLFSIVVVLTDIFIRALGVVLIATFGLRGSTFPNM
jgi:hypothetical protein